MSIRRPTSTENTGRTYIHGQPEQRTSLEVIKESGRHEVFRVEAALKDMPSI
jgi:hypothetical protein